MNACGIIATELPDFRLERESLKNIIESSKKKL